MSSRKSLAFIGIAACSMIILIVFLSTLSTRSNDKSAKLAQNASANTTVQKIGSEGKKEDSSLKQQPVFNDIVDIQLLSKIANKSVNEIIDMEWDSWGSEVSLSQTDSVLEALQDMDINDNNMLISKSGLTNLYETLNNLLNIYQSNNYNDYFKYLQQTGETVSPRITLGIQNIMQNELGINKDSLPEDSWQLLKKFTELVKVDSYWSCLIPHESNIKLFQTTNSKLGHPGNKYKDVRKSIATYFHIAQPSSALPDVIKTHGDVTVADVTLFIKHNEEMGSIVRPYILRLWYDSDNEQWRPWVMSAFHSRNKKVPLKIIF